MRPIADIHSPPHSQPPYIKICKLYPLLCPYHACIQPPDAAPTTPGVIDFKTSVISFNLCLFFDLLVFSKLKATCFEFNFSTKFPYLTGVDVVVSALMGRYWF